MLCMVLVICNSVSILADTPAAAATSVEKQVKETKTAKDEGESKEDKAAGDEEEESKQSEETGKEDSDQEEAPEVKTTEKKEETTEATTEKKEDESDKADEATTKSKDETSKAGETTTEAKDETSEAEATAKDETTETEGKTANTTEAEETAKTTEEKDDAEKADNTDNTEAAPTELTYEDDDVKVTVSAVAKGAIPENAELKVVPILKDDTETQAQYTEVEKKIQEKAAETETEIKGFLAYDITFVDEDGNEIEPNSEVKVSMEYKEAALPAEITAEDAKTSEVSVMHLEEDGAGNVSKVVDMGEASQLKQIEATEKNAVQKTEFVTNSFSVFTITWTYKNGDKLNIKAHYGYMEGNSFIEFEESKNYDGRNEYVEIKWNAWYDNNSINLQEYADKLGAVTENFGLTNIRILNANGTEANYLQVERRNTSWNPFSPNYEYNLQSSVDGSDYRDVAGYSDMDGNQEIDVYYIFDRSPSGITLMGHYGYLDGDEFVEFATDTDESTTKELKTVLFAKYNNSLTNLYDYQNEWAEITNDDYRFLGASLKDAKGQDAQYIKLVQTGKISRRYNIQSSMSSDDNFIDLEGYMNMTSDENKTLDVYYVFEKVDSGGSGGQGGTIDYPRELTKYKRAVRNDDGTYDLTLSISGTTGTIDNKTKIDVMMVLDVSGSMRETAQGNRDSKIIKSAEAIDVLVDSLDQDTIDARYNVVTFGTNSEVLTGWSWDAEKVKASVNAEAEAIDHAGDSYSQGTNYEAGMVTAQAQMARARANAMQVIVFLTDGEPTYYISDNNPAAGRGSETSINTLNNTLNAASNLSASSFYVIGLDMRTDISIYESDSWIYESKYYGNDNYGHHISGSIDTDDLLQWICNASGIEGAKKYNETNPNNLVNIFGNIAGEVATIACKNVTVTDQLSQYAEPAEDSPTLWIKLYGKGDDGKFDFDNPLEVASGANPTLNYSGDSEKENVQGVSAKYENGVVTLDFPDNYELNPEYTYEVGIKIKPSNEAYTSYQDDGGYPTNVTGDADTGTHSGEEGFYSNESATVTYDYTEGNENPEPEEFPKPVIQIKENLEPVNFYLNLSSTIADTTGEVENQEAKYFTTSVSGSKSGINTDLVMKLPKTHNHKEIFDNQPTDEQGNKVQVGVIAGDSDTSAKEVDEIIRNLETGTPGNQEGYNNPNELYQIVNSERQGAFPDDGDIFKYIRTNWDDEGDKVNKGQDITVNGIPIDVQNLTEENFSIRWYVVKDDVTDYWHIDGVLVPKSGILNVTKTFSNQEIVNQLSNTFSVTVTGDFLNTTESTVRLPLDEAEEVTTNPDGSVTYTWPSLAVFGGEYTIAEEGYDREGLTKWEYVDTDYVYINASNERQEGKRTSVTINTDKAEVDSTPKIQSFAFTNNYTLKTAELDLVKTSKNSTTPIDGAVFKLSKKRGNDWIEVQGNISVSNKVDQPELSGLVTDTIYKLEEIEAPEAHMLLGEPIYFTVEDGTVKLCDENGVTNSGAGTNKMWSLNQEGNVLTIKNNILYDLPSAGGPGIYWYTLSGTLLMAGAALIVYKEKRKREVLLRK